MLIRFRKDVSLNDVTFFTERCDELGVKYKYIQELSRSYLVVESAEHSKLEELYHQFRHVPVVELLSFPQDPDDPLSKIDPVKLKAGNRWIGRGNRPVIIAGSPYLESQRHSVDLASALSIIGVNIYKGGAYRPTETLSPKDLYERTGAIIDDIKRKSGLPSSGTIEVLGPKSALSQLKPDMYYIPGEFLFDTNLKEQLAKIGTPLLLERHPDATTELWLQAAGDIVAEGFHEVALVETGRRDSDHLMVDIAEIARLVETHPLPILVHASRVAKTEDELISVARASLAAGCAGVIIDVHPDPLKGLLTSGYCLSLDQFRQAWDSLKSLTV